MLKKVAAAGVAAALAFALPVGSAFAAVSPDADSPDANSPDADSPDADSPDADSPDADSPDADSPDADSPDADAPAMDVSRARSVDNAMANLKSGNASDAVLTSPKTSSVDLVGVAGVTAVLVFGAAGATLVLRKRSQ